MKPKPQQKVNPAVVAALVVAFAVLLGIALYAMLLDLRYDHEEDMARITSGQDGPLTAQESAGRALVYMCQGGMILCVCLGLSLLLPQNREPCADAPRKRKGRPSA